VTGRACASLNVYYSDLGWKESTFNPDVDNITFQSYVDSYMIVPFIGNLGLAGLMQLINKTEGEILDYDVKRAKGVQKMLGVWIENVKQLGRTVNTVFQITNILRNCDSDTIKADKEMDEKHILLRLVDKNVLGIVRDLNKVSVEELLYLEPVKQKRV
jgi:hypothetical protein